MTIGGIALKVVFMGTPSFAVPSLRALAAVHDVRAVYTQPDRPAGRGRHLSASPVKEVATSLGIPLRQPATLRDAHEVAFLRSLACDVVCVAAYGLILPPDILSAPRYGCVNVHASLLPAYRGAAPVHRAILDGVHVTGVSIMRMEEGLDTGPYASQVTVPVGDATVEELTEVLAEAGARALLEVLADIEAGRAVWTTQDGERATYAPKITRHHVALDPGLHVADALRRVRASSRSAPARLCLGGTTLTVVRAHASEIALEPGEARFEEARLVIGLADGAIALTEVRPEGRASMEGACFARGARLTAECHWAGCP